MFASDAGVVHATHRLTRGQVAFRRGDRQLECLEWRQADSVEVMFRAHGADQLQEGAVRARTRDEVRGPRSGYRTGGGTVALMRQVKAFRYGKATKALRDKVEKSGRDPRLFALHSIRIGGTSTMAAGGDISGRLV